MAGCPHKIRETPEPYSKIRSILTHGKGWLVGSVLTRMDMKPTKVETPESGYESCPRLYNPCLAQTFVFDALPARFVLCSQAFFSHELDLVPRTYMGTTWSSICLSMGGQRTSGRLSGPEWWSSHGLPSKCARSSVVANTQRRFLGAES